MILQFPVVHLEPKTDLSEKLVQLDRSSALERIIGTILLYDQSDRLVFKTDAVIDTGATITLLPGMIWPI